MTSVEIRQQFLDFFISANINDITFRFIGLDNAKVVFFAFIKKNAYFMPL